MTVVIAVLMPVASDDYNKDVRWWWRRWRVQLLIQIVMMLVMRSNWELRRRVEGRMQAAEIAEQQAGCSSAVQPQGGRFPLRSHTHVLSVQKKTHQHKLLDCCVANLFTLQWKVKPAQCLILHCAIGVSTATATDSLQLPYYSISAQQKLIIVSTLSYA